MSEFDFQLPQASGATRLSTDGPAIVVEKLRKTYDGEREILKGISFELERGKIYSIMGPSGCGKTTMLKALIGAAEPTSGNVYIDGIDIWAGGKESLLKARRKFGVLFQSSALLNGLTCFDNIALPLRQHTTLDESTIDVMVRMKLELVGMGHAAQLKPPELSGGMQKRCALARAIALDPAIVFFDEPSAGIDPVMISVLDRLVMDLTEKLGITSVVVTHEIPSAFRISDEILMFFEGNLQFRGTPKEMMDSEDPYVRQFVKGSAEGPLSQMSNRQAVASRVMGIPASEFSVAQEAPKAKVVPKSDELSSRFKDAQASVLLLKDDTRAKRTAKLSKDSPAYNPDFEEKPTERVGKEGDRDD